MIQAEDCIFAQHGNIVDIYRIIRKYCWLLKFYVTDKGGPHFADVRTFGARSGGRSEPVRRLNRTTLSSGGVIK